MVIICPKLVPEIAIQGLLRYGVWCGGVNGLRAIWLRDNGRGLVLNDYSRNRQGKRRRNSFDCLVKVAMVRKAELEGSSSAMRMYSPSKR